jgi:hypothetical protein
MSSQQDQKQLEQQQQEQQRPQSSLLPVSSCVNCWLQLQALCCTSRSVAALLLQQSR